MMSRRGNASKNAILGLVAVIILAAAGFIAFKTLGEGSAESAHLAALEKGREYQSQVSRKLGADEEKRFSSVSLTAGPMDFDPKVKVKVEISGRVATQKALDDLKKLIADNPAPVDLVWSVNVVPIK